MGQWGACFREASMELCFHVDTEAFEPIGPDSLIDAVFLIGGEKDEEKLEEIRKRDIGRKHSEVVNERRKG